MASFDFAPGYRIVRPGAWAGSRSSNCWCRSASSACWPGITSVAFAGFDSSSSAVSCRADRTRLQRAESTFYLQKARYGTEAELVSAGLLGSDSDIHDVTVASSAYTISEVGRCIGTSTAYNIAAPTVGTTTHSGVTVAVMNADGTGVSGAVVSYSQGSWTTMGTTASTGQVNAALADGTYDFRVVLGGTTNTLSGVSVKQGTLVTFPTVAAHRHAGERCRRALVGRRHLGEEQRRLVVVAWEPPRAPGA